jgi:hypothetical protein
MSENKSNGALHNITIDNELQFHDRNSILLKEHVVAFMKLTFLHLQVLIKQKMSK